jgi:WD40 repeat protein
MADIQFGELPFLEIGGPIGICAISSDGKYLAVSSSTPRWKVHIYDTAIWTRIASHFGGPALAFSRTRQELAMGTPNNAVVLCDALTGNVRLALTGLADPAICISYSADGTQVAAACGDKRVHVWSSSSGDTMCILQENIATAPEYAARRIVFGSISAAVFSPMDSEIMTCGEYATSLLWDSQTGKVLTAFEGQGATVSCLAYSPDGHQIATGGGDQCVRLWNVSSGKLCLLFRGHSSSISNVSFSPDGRQVSSCGKDGTIHIWNPVNGEQVSQLLGHYYGSTQAVYSPANDYIASAGVDWIVRLWSVGANTRSVFSRRYFDFGTSLCLDFSAAGEHILTSNGSSDGRMRLLDSLTGNSQDILTGCTKRVLNLALSPCSTMIASLHDDFKLRLWDTRTGDLLYVFEGHTQSLCGLAFSPTGLHRVVTGSADKTVRVWNTMTGGEPVLVLVGHDSMIRMVTYSPSGHQIAAATGDQTVCVWCSQTGASLFVLDNFGGTSNLKYSPNGQHLISVIGAGLSCWDTQSGQRVDRFDAIDSELTACTFLPNGRLVATCGKDEMLRVWDICPSFGRGAGCKEVYRTRIGRISMIQWKEDVNGSLYLLMLSGAFSLSVWNLAEIGDGVGGGIARYHIRLVWCMGPGELTLEGVRVEDAIGLSPSNLKLLEQRGAITSTK